MESFISHLKRLDAQKRKPHHAQQQQSVAKTRNLRFAIGAVGITHGNLDDFETQPRCAEDEIKITERIEVAEITECVLEADVSRIGAEL